MHRHTAMSAIRFAESLIDWKPRVTAWGKPYRAEIAEPCGLCLSYQLGRFGAGCGYGGLINRWRANGADCQIIFFALSSYAGLCTNTAR